MPTQSINVYCPNLACIQLTTRWRRLLVTLDQLRTMLQSTSFTTGSNRSGSIYNNQSCSSWFCPMLSFLASLLILTFFSALPYPTPFFPPVWVFRCPPSFFLSHSTILGWFFYQLFTPSPHNFFLLLLLFLSHRCLFLSHLGLQLSFYP